MNNQSKSTKSIPIILTLAINTLLILIFTCPIWITAWLEYVDARDQNEFIQSISAMPESVTITTESIK